MKSHFSGNRSFWLVETDFLLIANFIFLFGAFSCRWTLEIRCKPIFFHFFIPNLTAEAVFPASGNELFMEYFIPASGRAFSAESANWNHYLNKGGAMFYRATSLLLFEAIFYMLFRYSCWWKQLSGIVETYFFNESFILAGGIRIYVYRKQYRNHY